MNQKVSAFEKKCVSPPFSNSFLPASFCNRIFEQSLDRSELATSLAIVLQQPTGLSSQFRCRIFAHGVHQEQRNYAYVERMLKALLWTRGGNRVLIAGSPAIAKMLSEAYSPTGPRSFDYHFLGQRVFGGELTIESCAAEDLPETFESNSMLGGNKNGCRIGFDLGGTSRKVVAMIDGEVVFTERAPWDPYFQSDPEYHRCAIKESLESAAAHLPRVDGIGGSAAGVYVNNEVRAGAIFRGVSDQDFNRSIRSLFLDIQRDWGGVPFKVVNDGDVAALAGSMGLGVCSVLGMSMGTSQAGGYVTAQGGITDWLNELAFVPVDYQPHGHVDEWSMDAGVGAQYFSQQAVARLAPEAGICLPTETPIPEVVAIVQDLLTKGDRRARAIFETIGVYLGYAIPHYARFYPLRHVLLMGGVTTGESGEIVVSEARRILENEFPDLDPSVKIHLPEEESKRFGQAIAAATLPL